MGSAGMWASARTMWVLVHVTVAVRVGARIFGIMSFIFGWRVLSHLFIPCMKHGWMV